MAYRDRLVRLCTTIVIHCRGWKREATAATCRGTNQGLPEGASSSVVKHLSGAALANAVLRIVTIRPGRCLMSLPSTKCFFSASFTPINVQPRTAGVCRQYSRDKEIGVTLQLCPGPGA